MMSTMVSTPDVITVEEYLATVYKPDVDFVDDHIEERHMGERSHGAMIFRLMKLLSAMPRVFPYLETRTKITPTRWRVPDVCVYLDAEQEEQRFTSPPRLCIEVKSPDNRLSRLATVAGDYFSIGVPDVWIVDPFDREVYVCRPDRSFQLAEGQIATIDRRIVLTADQIFG